MWNAIHLIARTALRDVSGFIKFGRYLAFVRYANYRDKTVPVAFQEVAKRHPQKTMFIHGDQQWTFKQADMFTNQVGNYFSSQGLRAGDDVALMMENRPELVLLWLGLSKIGVSTALLNTNLRGRSLFHCTSMVKTKAVIFSTEMSPYVADIAADLRQLSSPKLYHYEDAVATVPARAAVTTTTTTTETVATTTTTASKTTTAAAAAEDQTTKTSAIGTEVRRAILDSPATSIAYRGHRNDTVLFVYTSGTTGLPKAARLRHSRFFLTAAASRYMANVNDDDIEYCFLPLYHFAGGVMQLSQTILFGVTAVIVRGFSASTFWDDCIKYRCTATQYIGEICRYLLAQPKRPQDRQHSMRIMIGNGLRPQIWKEFQERFGIPEIREIYGATEGNGNIMNITGHPGAVGMFPTICRLSPTFARKVFHRFIIRVDPDTGEPLRGPDGLCILVGPNEPGEYVAEITNRPETEFDGYTDDEASDKKIYRNVMRKGDRFFASGDMLLYDDDGYVFFKDRTGDTFRWKGENVSTTEVEGVISKHVKLADCAVIGVEVPGCEGKAGMAVILDPQRQVLPQDVLRKISTELPAYAIPLFVRLAEQLERTGTFKLQKNRLVCEGFDVRQITDPVYFLDAKAERYIPLDQNLYNDIMSGRLRV